MLTMYRSTRTPGMAKWALVDRGAMETKGLVRCTVFSFMSWGWLSLCASLTWERHGVRKHHGKTSSYWWALWCFGQYSTAVFANPGLQGTPPCICSLHVSLLQHTWFKWMGRPQPSAELKDLFALGCVKWKFPDMRFLCIAEARSSAYWVCIPLTSLLYMCLPPFLCGLSLFSELFYHVL